MAATAHVRRAGTGRTGNGDTAWWSVAEGRRGRRWREAIAGAAGLRHSLLLETDPDGRFSHLELATPAGLLTLHPEGEGTLHGNALVGAGLRHVAGLPWGPDGLVDVAGSPIARAAMAWLLARSSPSRGTRRLVLRLTAELGVSVEGCLVSRGASGTWRLAGGDPLIADADGLPLLDAAASWPLELPG
jgi:hypothetical protein